MESTKDRPEQPVGDSDLLAISEFYKPESIAGNFLGKHIVTVEQFSQEDLNQLFATANEFQQAFAEGRRQDTQLARGYLLSVLFFESSTRTDLSFQAAMSRLAGEVVSVSNGIRFSSVYKGENLADTVRAAGCYSDVVVLRHPVTEASLVGAYYLDLLAEQIKRRPVLISGGCGVGEHPTQALLDLFTIVENRGSADNLSITMVGDLKHGRTVHSLTKLLALYKPQNTTVNFVSPSSLKMPPEIVDYLKEVSIEVQEAESLEALIKQSDVLYWTRVQEERFEDPRDYLRVKDNFIMTPELLQQAKDEAILMHPLPRKGEMGTEEDHQILDQDSRSIYFQQMENGMLVRMALLSKVLGLR